MSNAVRRICRLWGCAILFFVSCTMATQEESQPSASGNVVLKGLTIATKQGVAVDAKYVYAISNTIIIKCDKMTGKVIATWQANRKDEAYKHFFHHNSGTVVDGKLYCAHSRYGIDSNDCTVEIWNVEGETLEHEETIHMPRKHGSLTWIDRRSDGSWWMCYAVYGKESNKNTKLVRYQYKDEKFIEVESWFFPQEVVAHWGDMSCSGGSWGRDGYLYTTGHDHSEAYVLEADKDNRLSYVRTEKDVGFFGQGIAWDRSSAEPILWGISRSKEITRTLIPAKVK